MVVFYAAIGMMMKLMMMMRMVMTRVAIMLMITFINHITMDGNKSNYSNNDNLIIHVTVINIKISAFIGITRIIICNDRKYVVHRHDLLPSASASPDETDVPSIFRASCPRAKIRRRPQRRAKLPSLID